jgi:threonine/homoserine/homoserine lactone efflux protein
MPVALEIWSAYTLAAATIILIPGPTSLFVLSQALGHGPRTALVCLLGVALGDAVALTVSFAGLGALLAASANLFNAMKLAGAAYLFWLGWRMWRVPVQPVTVPAPTGQMTARGILRAFSVTVVNPKGIAFFTAFVPQFVDPARPLTPQLVVFGGTFVALAVLIPAVWITALGRVRMVMLRPTILRGLNRAGAVVLFGAGLLTATMRRA